MKIKQWIYTTSCWNIRGQSGWNTFSYSHGLTDDEVEELERKCQVPGNLEEAYFPVYETLTLESGRKVICQTVEQGCSFYDGRPGATLTHAFIIEAEDEWPLPAVSYIGSPTFWADLPEHLKQQALNYRDHATGQERPDYLPELDDWELLPGEGYTLESMQQKLYDPAIAAAVSAVLHELFLIEEQQYPLRYSCEPALSNCILAALFYLAPGILEAQSMASIYRTGGSITQYNFLRLTGTRDSNAHVRAESYRGEVHPLLVSARHNLSAWYAFCKECRLEAPTGISALAELFELMHGPELSSITDAEAQAVLAVPEDVLGVSIKKKLGVALAAAHTIELSNELFMLLSTRLIRYFNQTLYVFDEAEKQAWRALIRAILSKAAELCAAGELPPAQAAELCELNPSLPKLWLSDKWLSSIFSGSPLQRVPLLQLTMQVASLAGDDAQDWLAATSTGRALVEQFAQSTTMWESFVLDSSEPGYVERLCSLWARLCEAVPAAAETQREVMNRLYRALPDAQLRELQKLYLQRHMVGPAIQAFTATHSQTSYGMLMREEELFDTSSEYEEQLLQQVLHHLTRQTYSLQEGRWLLKKLEKHAHHKQLSIELTNNLFGGWRPTAITPEGILFMQELSAQLRHAALSAEQERCLHFLASLHTLQQIAREQPAALPDGLRRYALPALGSAHAPEALSAEDQELYRPLFLRYALELARDKSVFKLLMQTADWGWSQACFISACKEMIQAQATREPWSSLPEPLISLLAALAESEDLYLLRCVLDSSGELLFGGLSKSKAAVMLTELKMSVGSYHTHATTLVEQAVNKNRKSLMSQVLTKIFR